MLFVIVWKRCFFTKKHRK